MKKVFLIALLAAGQFVSAQITKNLGDFTTIKAFDQIDVTLVKSAENKIIINGSRQNDVEIVTKNDELKIRMKLSKLLKGEDVSVTVFYTGNINRIEASEGARIASQDTFSAKSFELNAKEGAEIKLNIEAGSLKSNASSGGILNITGSAGNHDSLVKAGGILRMKGLETKTAAVTINAGGEADIYVTDSVVAKTRAGGDINIYGNPKTVDQTQFAGGRIKVIKS